MGPSPSVFPGTHTLAIQELSQPPPNRTSYPSFPSNGTRMPETQYALSRSHRSVFFISLRFRKQIGVGWVQGTIANGKRSSSATSYVGPEYINRPNLHILLHAHATKLLEAAGLGTATPTFNGVEFATGPSSKSIRSTTPILPFTGYKVKGGG